uniref:Acyl_transf_3 domain-containing protein n=1 Tax=Haemonchus contortus TaxID=6289 RepID=A0A7I5E877_HAECO|nr:Acyltransferase 3 domain containing protein [Haemonchus contortus]
MTLFRAFLLLTAAVTSSYASLKGYDEDFVMRFINRSQTLDIDEKCRDSLGKVHEYLQDHDTLETQSINYYDSFATGPSHLFLSRDQDRWVYRGYGCLVSAGETIYSKSEYPMHFCYSHDDTDSPVEAYGVCLPTPCADDHVDLLKEWRAMTKPEEADLPMDFTSCTRSRHEKQWFEKFIPVADLAFNLLLLMLVIMATIFHNMRGESVKTMSSRILLAFSAKKNLQRLVQLPKDPQSCITCMFGMRVLSMIWTLVGHSFIFVQAYLENVEYFKTSMVNNFWNQWITNFTLSVDTFFVLGGTVLSYSWFRKWLKNTTEEEPTWTSYSYWLRFYRHRVVRLWPAYLYTLMAVTLRLSVTHFHPMWPPTDPAIQCPKHWFENVFFINSLFNNRCMPWTWYIGTEFLYYLVSPIFLLTLRQTPKLGLALCLFTISASAGLNTVKMVQRNFPPTQFLWRQPEMFNPNFIQHHIEIYIKPQYRIGPYIIGLMLGYILANFQRQAIKPMRSAAFVATGWLVGFLCGFWALFGLYPSLQGWNWPLYHLVYGTIHRDVFAISMAWLIYACHTGLGGIINRILSANFLVPLSNLCYSVYLFHMIPVVLTYLLVPFPIIFENQWAIFIHCSIQLLISYIFALICTLVAEYPAHNIESILLSPNQSKTTLKTIPTSDSELQLKKSSNPL